MNNRRNFIKTLGLASAGTLVPVAPIFGQELISKKTASSCTLIPTETAGPFPLDLTANTAFFRQDIRESKAGVQLNLKLKIIGDQNCEPMQNVRVNVWHCDKDGVYSGYNTAQNPGSTSSTYMRGYQMTDSNGEVEFITIFPGWYNGRICHIHFQVYINSTYAAISQLTFDVTTKNAIYTNNSSIYTNGTDPMTLANDNIFSDGYSYQMASLTPNSTTGGYDAELEVTVEGTGTTVGLPNYEKLMAQSFSMGQNYPNPHNGSTSIPFTLNETSDVKLVIFDLMGKKVTEINKSGMTSGDHELDLDFNSLGLSIANYVYQLEVQNSLGTYVDSKIMTASK